MKYIAFGTKGLIDISVEEIHELFADVSVVSMTDKVIVFETNAPISRVVQLRTVDDVCILLLESDAQNIPEVLSSVDMEKALKEIKQFRDFNTTEFSVTYSQFKPRNIKKDDVLKPIISFITGKTTWKYSERERADIDFRVHIEEDKLYFGIRVAKESLQHRDYYLEKQVGALKPPIAACLVRLAARGRKKLNIVDNLCGSGTILLESLQQGHDISGGDGDTEAVRITKKNFEQLLPGASKNITREDCTVAFFDAKLFDCAISNFPYGKQIPLLSKSRLYEGCIKEYARILKSDGALVLLVTEPDLAIHSMKRYLPNHTIRTRKIGFLGQTPTVVTAFP